jgi:hypothetical protein
MILPREGHIIMAGKVWLQRHILIFLDLIHVVNDFKRCFIGVDIVEGKDSLNLLSPLLVVARKHTSS